MTEPLEAGALARARGAWLGQIVGDALGTTLEFMSAARIAEKHPAGLRQVVGGGPFKVLPGQVTDDTELALALARSLDERGRYEPDAAAAAYVAWYRSGPFDVGGTTAAAFGGKIDAGPGVAARVALRASRTSQANGALMRLTALPIQGWRLAPADLAALAAFDARLSHPHEVCQAANAIQAHAIALAIREGTDPRATWERTLVFARAEPRCAPLVGLLEEAERGVPADFSANMGWVRIALQNAFYRLLHAPSFEEGVVQTVMQGGDTDTNACIAGALLGAVHGEAAIPAQWRETVLGCVTRRGPIYQTGDAREIAARLLEAGRAPAPIPDLEAALVPPPSAGEDPPDWEEDEEEEDEDEALGEDEPWDEEPWDEEGSGEPGDDEDVDDEEPWEDDGQGWAEGEDEDDAPWDDARERGEEPAPPGGEGPGEEGQDKDEHPRPPGAWAGAGPLFD